jgi:hypothetical protein
VAIAPPWSLARDSMGHEGCARLLLERGADLYVEAKVRWRWRIGLSCFQTPAHVQNHVTAYELAVTQNTKEHQSIAALLLNEQDLPELLQVAACSA